MQWNLSSIESFGWILEKIEFICDMGTVQSYLGKRGCRNSNKKLNFGNLITKILAAQNYCPATRWSAQRRIGWKETNCGNQVVEIVEEWGERK